MKNRIIGFDLARAYAIFGMFIVNFNTVFGSHTNHNGLSGFLSLFNGNSSTLFVILAGMGISLMTNKVSYTLEEQKKLKNIIIKRSWFLFALGLFFYIWWTPDILHFYGGYMHFAVFLIFLPKKYYLYAAVSAIIIFHVLLFIIPYETGWNFDTLQYKDFWSLSGFLRNTFYNGWNSIFPWVAYFLLGMYLGRLNWQAAKTKNAILIIGLIVYGLVSALQFFADEMFVDKDILFYIQADYVPPFLPFMLSTASFGLILISVFMMIGEKFGEAKMAHFFASTGQMTLTHYIAHIFLGSIMLSFITGKSLSNQLINEPPTDPMIILAFALVYYAVSCVFSYFWKKRFNYGPLEMLMRKISG